MDFDLERELIAIYSFIVNSADEPFFKPRAVAKFKNMMSKAPQKELPNLRAWINLMENNII